MNLLYWCSFRFPSLNWPVMWMKLKPSCTKRCSSACKTLQTETRKSRMKFKCPYRSVSYECFRWGGLHLFQRCVDISQCFHYLPVFHSYFSEFNRTKNQLVMENLRDQGYKPLRPETCGLVFMRAAITRYKEKYSITIWTACSVRKISSFRLPYHHYWR